MVFHVDDGAYCVKTEGIWKWYLAQLDKKYRYLHGPLQHFLNVRFTFSEDLCQVKLDQEQQIQKLLDIIPGMSQCKPVATPINLGEVPRPCKADSPQTEDEKAEAARFPYQTIVGHLSYLVPQTRPDVANVTKIATFFMTCHGPAMHRWVKRILRYLKGTASKGLIIAKGDETGIKVYSDSDAKCPDTRRSLSGVIIKYNGNTVYWNCKLQRIVSHSTPESELMAMDFSLMRAEHIRMLAASMCAPIPKEPIGLYVDCQTAIDIGTNPDFQGRA